MGRVGVQGVDRILMDRMCRRLYDNAPWISDDMERFLCGTQMIQLLLHQERFEMCLVYLTLDGHVRYREILEKSRGVPSQLE